MVFSDCWLLPYCYIHIHMCVPLLPLKFSEPCHSIWNLEGLTMVILFNNYKASFNYSIQLGNMMCRVLKSDIFFLHIFCNFDWYYPEFSHCSYLTRVPCDVILYIKLHHFLRQLLFSLGK